MSSRKDIDVSASPGRADFESRPTYHARRNHRDKCAARTIQLEPLECRRHFSVTVTEGYPGFYEVNGDDSADVIAVSVSMAEASFTLDGATYSNVSYIFVHGNGGDDTITVTSTDGAGSIGASITGDDGDDQLALNFDGGVWGGAGADVLNLADSFRGVAYGQEGNDRIYLMGLCLNAEADGGDGSDLIDCSNNQYGVLARGGGGNDTIYGSAHDDRIYGDAGSDRLVGGAGSDLIDAVDGEPDQIVRDRSDIIYADTSDTVLLDADNKVYTLGVEEFISEAGSAGG